MYTAHIDSNMDHTSLAQDIVSKLDHPNELEALYQLNTGAFRQAFYHVFPQISDNLVARVWNERLCQQTTPKSWMMKSDLIAFSIMVVLAGTIARIPSLFNLNEELFYQRNISFILIPFVVCFFIWKNKLSITKALIPVSIITASAIFINLLPENTDSDILILTSLHLPLFLWFWTGFAFSGKSWRETETRMQFIRFNGDWVVMTTILGITTGLVTAITVGLFDIIDISLETFLQDYALYWMVPAVPLLAAVLVLSPQNMVSRIAPIVARIVTPLVIVILFTYLAAMMVSGKSPFTDREFLMIFNIVLIGVMALISFSFIGSANHGLSRGNKTQLTVLSLLAVVVNAVALSAITFRIAEWGLTPNRLAVLGSNILMMTHLILVTTKLFKSMKESGSDQNISGGIVNYIPVYMIWTAIVTFLFPLFSALSEQF